MRQPGDFATIRAQGAPLDTRHSIRVKKRPGPSSTHRLALCMRRGHRPMVLRRLPQRTVLLRGIGSPAGCAGVRIGLHVGFNLLPAATATGTLLITGIATHCRRFERDVVDYVM